MGACGNPEELDTLENMASTVDISPLIKRIVGEWKENANRDEKIEFQFSAKPVTVTDVFVVKRKFRPNILKKP